METVLHGVSNVHLHGQPHVALLHSHLEQLDTLLHRIMQHGIKTHLPKCKFGYQEVAYLGFHLTEAGILLRADKLRAVHDMPPPSNDRARS